MCKLLLFYTLVSYVVCFPDEMQELSEMLHQTCVQETGVAESLIVNARNGKFDDDDSLKCYMKCILEQMACIDDEGIIDVEATIAVLPEEFRSKTEPIIRKCETKIGKDPCDNAWLTNQCWYQEMPNEYVLV